MLPTPTQPQQLWILTRAKTAYWNGDWTVSFLYKRNACNPSSTQPTTPSNAHDVVKYETRNSPSLRVPLDQIWQILNIRLPLQNP